MMLLSHLTSNLLKLTQKKFKACILTIWLAIWTFFFSSLGIGLFDIPHIFVYIFYNYLINLVVYKPTKQNWVKILLFDKKNKEVTNLTNGFFEEMAQSNHIFKWI